jgi:hypothetical protein
LVNGNSAPFLALVGVSLASGAGLITKEDELECVFREVRVLFEKYCFMCSLKLDPRYKIDFHIFQRR